MRKARSNLKYLKSERDRRGIHYSRPKGQKSKHGSQWRRKQNKIKQQVVWNMITKYKA